MSYEQLREQCAQIAEKMPDFSRDAFGPVQHRIATTIRALPLPEVKQEPIYLIYKCSYPSGVWIVATKEAYERNLKGGWRVRLAYESHPSVEALQKENEQLQSNIQKIQKLLSDDGYAISFQTFGQYRSALIKELKGSTQCRCKELGDFCNGEHHPLCNGGAA
ncbi:hypothetical protein [Undibacterium rivi]|nr:hypothetical protein [Undibacterium rivi]